jgi:hypothetical protein
MPIQCMRIMKKFRESKNRRIMAPIYAPGMLLFIKSGCLNGDKM